ncbi:hypothetical protein Tco_0852920 [Tanacetum coccineum]
MPTVKPASRFHWFNRTDFAANRTGLQQLRLIQNLIDEKPLMDADDEDLQSADLQWVSLKVDGKANLRRLALVDHHKCMLTTMLTTR